MDQWTAHQKLFTRIICYSRTNRQMCIYWFLWKRVVAIRILTDFHGRAPESASGTNAMICRPSERTRAGALAKIAFELKITAGPERAQMIQLAWQEISTKLGVAIMHLWFGRDSCCLKFQDFNYLKRIPNSWSVLYLQNNTLNYLSALPPSCLISHPHKYNQKQTENGTCFPLFGLQPPKKSWLMAVHLICLYKTESSQCHSDKQRIMGESCCFTCLARELKSQKRPKKIVFIRITCAGTTASVETNRVQFFLGMMVLQVYTLSGPYTNLKGL